MSKKRKSTRKIARSAVNGRFVTKEYAESHPNTTVIETLRIKKRRKKKK